MYGKVYVDVLCAWTKEGEIIPKAVKWTDGRRYKIDKVLDVRQSAAPGGWAMRYTVQTCGQESYLFRQKDRWFATAK